MARMLTVGLGRGDQSGRDRRGRAARGRSSPRSAATPTTPSGFDDEARGRDRPPRRPREGAGDRRDRARLLPRQRRLARSSGAPSPRQIEIAIELDLPIVIHARDPEGGSEAIDEIFATLDARADGHAGDPPLLLGAAAGRRRGRARLVLLLRRQRHLPQRRGPALRGGQGARRPDPGRDRRPLPLAAAAARQAQRSPPTWSRPPRSSPPSAASPTSSCESTVEANARALFGW